MGEAAAEAGGDEWEVHDGARWGEWLSMGGIITSAPAVSVDAEGMLHVFCRGITRALTHRTLTPTPTPTPTPNPTPTPTPHPHPHPPPLHIYTYTDTHLHPPTPPTP